MAFTRSWVRLPSPPLLIMSDNTMNPVSLDPELDALLGDVPSSDIVSDYSKLLAEQEPAAKAIAPEELIEDLSQEEFPQISRFEQDPDPVFLEKSYYAKVLTGGDEASQRLHSLLQKFLKESDPQNKGVLRHQMVQAWWDFLSHLVMSYRNNAEKRWALRFGYLLPTLLTAEQRSMLARIVPENEYNEPIHYLDEWLELVSRERVNPLATDDLDKTRRTPQVRTRAQVKKIQGSKDAFLSLLQTLTTNRKDLETQLEGEIQMLLQHDLHSSILGVQEAYRAEQQSALQRAMKLLKDLNSLNHEIANKIGQIEETDRQINKFQKLMKESGDSDIVDKHLMEKELDSIRQMIKLCVGRQGNHFPFLMQSYIASSITLIATRENVIRGMEEIEQTDPNLFQRTFKHRTLRIVPHTIIVPCYGNQGLCWEAFELFNRATSRGRIAVPMFPKDLKTALIYALGDLRWNVAKERAAQYWMNEGLTGEYFQYFSASNGRGDVKMQFLEDYLLWVTKEVEGVQKLEKEVRNIFWRLIPFRQSVKDKLRNRGFVYNTLYKKDINRSISDGY